MDLGRGLRDCPPPPLFWLKIKKKCCQGKRNKPPSPFSSRSGSATDINLPTVSCRISYTLLNRHIPITIVYLLNFQKYVQGFNEERRALRARETQQTRQVQQLPVSIIQVIILLFGLTCKTLSCSISSNETETSKEQVQFF